MTDASPAPTSPYLILGAAIVLPGSGHVLLRVPMRGLQFLFFMVILGWITTKIAPPDASFIGRHAGGFLIYALSVLDAYKIARVRYAKWDHSVHHDAGQSHDGSPATRN
jgi:membrane associated rhomboid family serine protease